MRQAWKGRYRPPATVKVYPFLVLRTDCIDRCDFCGKLFTPDSLVVRYANGLYHIDCYNQLMGRAD